MIRSTACACLALAVCAGGALAQAPAEPPTATEEVSPDAPPPITAEPISVGVAGIATGWFVPIRAELVSESALEARVELVTTDGLVIHEFGDVSFAAGQTHRLRTLLSASKLERADKVELRLTPTAGGRSWTTGEVSLLAVWSGLVLVLDKHGALPTDLTSLRPTYEPTTLSQAARLPEHSMAYAGVAAVLLGDLAVESWSDAQARALATWVKRGGHLMISVGPRARALRRSPLGKHLGEALGALPDAAPESGPLAEADLQALAGPPGEAVPALGKVATAGWARLLPGPRDVSQREGGSPLVATRRVGRGLIDVIAVDLWSEPFQFAPQTEQLLRDRLDWSRTTYESRSTLIKPALTLIPPPSSLGPVFAMLIAFALIAGPGVYFLLRGKRRGIWLWVAIPGLTLGCTLCMPIYRLSLADAESSLVGVSLIEQSQGDPLAVETIDLLVFSGGLDDKRLEFSGEDPTLVGVSPTGFQFLGDAPEALSVDLPIALWGARYVSLETAREPLEFEATVERPMWKPPVLSVKTGSLPRVQKLWVVVPGPGGFLVHSHVEPVLANEEVQIELDLEQFQPEQATTPHTTLFNTFLTSLCGDGLASKPDRAYVLVEFAQRLRVQVHPNVLHKESWSFALIEIPQVYTQGYPPGLGPLVPVSEEERVVADVAGIDSSLEVREVLYTIRSPKPPLRLDLLLGMVRMPEVETSLEGFLPAKGEWVPIGSESSVDENPIDNRISLRTDTPTGVDPRDLYDAESGTIRVRQRVILARRINTTLRWNQQLQVHQMVWDPEAVEAPPEPLDKQ